MPADIVECVAAKTVEVERLFAHVEECRPSAYVEVPAPVEEGRVTQKVFFSIIDSSGTLPPGQGRNVLEKYPTSPEAAYLSWLQNMDVWLAETPVRGKLFWRKKPELETDRDFETDIQYWNVYSRVAAI